MCNCLHTVAWGTLDSKLGSLFQFSWNLVPCWAKTNVTIWASDMIKYSMKHSLLADRSEAGPGNKLAKLGYCSQQIMALSVLDRSQARESHYLLLFTTYDGPIATLLIFLFVRNFKIFDLLE